MFYTMIKTQEITVEGQLQAHYFVEMFEDKAKTKSTGNQTLVVSGDALADPDKAFLDGVNARSENWVKTYAQERAIAYPSIVDQLDTLYHGGYDAWKASIDAVKTQYPKP
jgi:hypothetical protein